MNISNIVLIGMPGSGKSTISKILSKKTSRLFIDTDALIEASEKKKLQDIVNSDGNMAFRKIESKVIKKIRLKNHVIATGGSAVYSQTAMRHLKSIGIIVFLYTSLEGLKLRIDNFAERGIAKLPGQTLEDMFYERSALYKKYADITIDCSKLTPEQTCVEIIKQIN
ncbi:MAG: shikimate kinase [Deltaproteobacteria bacterium]|nr:shikimate kinase [Deltaproteobacteria bacterium]